MKYKDIRRKSFCPHTTNMGNAAQAGLCQKDCHFWDDEEGTCQEIVKTQLAKETVKLLLDIKTLLTPDKKPKLQIPKIDPPVEKKQPSRFQKIDKDKPNASSDSKGETQA